MAWEAVPTSECAEYDDARDTMGVRERIKTALMVVGMSLIGIGIGCFFVFVRWITGMEKSMH